MYKYQIAKEVFWEYIKRDDSEPDDYQVWLAKKLTATTEPEDFIPCEHGEYPPLCKACVINDYIQQEEK